MSRDIKFRAWQPHHSLHRKPGMYEVQDMVWYEPTSEGYTGEVFLAKAGEDAKSSEYFQDIKLMQFTGLRDSKGVEIYEGDIIRTDGVVAAVEWLSVGWSLLLVRPDVEVIGNIHEHPELLKAGDARDN